MTTALAAVRPPDVDDDSAHGWRARAACRGADDPEQFFPDVRPGRRTGPNGPLAVAQRAAHTYCGRCPVLDACHALAERTGSCGLFAGLYRAYGTEPIRLIPTAPHVRGRSDTRRGSAR